MDCLDKGDPAERRGLPVFVNDCMKSETVEELFIIRVIHIKYQACQ